MHIILGLIGLAVFALVAMFLASIVLTVVQVTLVGTFVIISSLIKKIRGTK